MTGSAEKGESKGEASPGSRSIAWGWSLIGFREDTLLAVQTVLWHSTTICLFTKTKYVAFNCAH